MKRWLVGILAVAVAAMLIPIALVGAEPPASVYFPKTGHTVGAPFLKYWREHGGLAVYGYPITEAFQEKSDLDQQTYTVQYFERARLESHPDKAAPWDIMLGQLGRHKLGKLVNPPAMSPLAPEAAPQGSRYFEDTKHSVGGAFLEYWQANGGIDQFGLPLTEEFDETNAKGEKLRVQYFERNRFEYHPTNADPYKVLLGLLGNDYTAEKKINTASVPRPAGIADYDEALFFTPTPVPPTATPVPPKPTEPRPDLGNAYIEVSIAKQHLYVWQGGEIIFDVAVSTGRPDWETPKGTFRIHTFIEVQDMEGGFPKGGPEYYLQPDVPWVMYFDYNGDAIHGVYWHNNFGVRASSHGCVGTPVWAAKWIYDWASIGTAIWIH